MTADAAIWLNGAMAALTLCHYTCVDIPGLLRHGLAYCKLSELKDR